jgi:hypothetical protein
MTWRFLSSALTEIADAAEYYEEKVAGLGSDFLDELEATISVFSDFRMLGANLRDAIATAI